LKSGANTWGKIWRLIKLRQLANLLRQLANWYDEYLSYYD